MGSLEEASLQQLGGATSTFLSLYQRAKRNADSPELSYALPEIVAYGLQGAAKSSTLTSLFNGAVRFPSDHGTCTKCVIVINGRRTTGQRTCHYRLRFNYDENNEQLETSREVNCPVQDPTNMEQCIRECQERVLKGPNGKAEGVMFTSNEVWIDLEGSDIPDLIVKDVPGLIDAEQDGSSIIDGLCKQSIEKPNVIVLLCMPCHGELESQPIKRLSEDALRRTIGVLTKPDTIEPSTESVPLQIFKNEHEKAKLLPHGYYAIRGRSKKEREDNKDAQEVELHFFSEHPIGKQFKEIQPDRCGRVNLLRAVSEAIEANFKKQLPRVQELMQLECDHTNKRLNEERMSIKEEHVRDFIVEQIGQIVQGLKTAIHCTGYTGDRKFWQQIAGKLKETCVALKQSKPEFSRGENGSVNAMFTIDYVEQLLSEGDAPLFVESLLMGPQGHYAVHKIIEKCMAPWQQLAQACVISVKQEVLNFCYGLSAHAGELSKTLNVHIKRHAENHCKEAAEQVDCLLRMYGVADSGEPFMNIHEDKIAALRDQKFQILRRGSQMSTQSEQAPNRLTSWTGGTSSNSIYVFRPWRPFIWQKAADQTQMINSSESTSSSQTGVKPEVLEVMTLSMAFFEVSYDSFADVFCKTIKHFLLRKFAESLPSMLRAEVQVYSREPKDLIKLIYGNDTLEEQKKLKHKLQAQEEIVEEIEDILRGAMRLASLPGSSSR
eukprot:gb/GFBE01068237.1/.p1 GENE.gb/GFBE01068237.1/~~gb/GFBE01068237.1/.p1  ORF type:complete len:718 (+),score=134.98 gb/GFBE01068237.1/:1-2154(+)